MGNVVIVAIPDENDRVWKISSEKVPHLTLLFMGEEDQVANLEQIMLFVEHAVDTTLKRFYLPVDRRGELGADQADVLFFKKNRYDFKAVRDFRSLLLKDPNIKTAYDSTKQFETPEAVGAPGQSWIPHLTLGYPETPAKKIPDEEFGGGIYSVEFSKIAVWTGDYEGPEFLLKDYGEEFDEMAIPMDVAMSDLQHVGVKGMKWGVRKDRPVETVGRIKGTPSSRPRKEGQTTVIKGSEKRFKRVSKTGGTYLALHDRAVNAATPDRKAINNKPEYKTAKFGFAPKVSIKLRGKDYGTPLHAKYRDEQYQNYVKHFNEQANRVTNEPGTRQYAFRDIPNAGKWSAKRELYIKDIEHADDSALIVELLLDDDGKVTGYKAEPKEDSMAQTADLGAAWLEHFGVKGMRWGVRNERSVATDIHVDTGVVRRKTKVRTKGGEAQPAHEDAVKAAVQKQKLKKSGTDALSNNELKDLASRLELEVRVETLATKKGRKFISRQLETQGQQQLQKGIGRGVSTGAARVVKKGGKAAGAAALLA